MNELKSSAIHAAIQYGGEEGTHETLNGYRLTDQLTAQTRVTRHCPSDPPVQVLVLPNCGYLMPPAKTLPWKTQPSQQSWETRH